MMRPSSSIRTELSDTARRIPSKCALVHGERRWTYGELDQAATRLTEELVQCGVRRGDRVVILGENSIEVAVAFWAVVETEAVAVILGQGTRASRLAHILDRTAATVLLADRSMFATVEQARSEARAVPTIAFFAPAEQGRLLDEVRQASSGDERAAEQLDDLDLASIVFTSGTSGEPKGVMVTHRAMRAAASSIASYLALHEEEVILNLLPFSFSYGLYQMIMAFRAGARVVLGRSLAFPGALVQLLATERITMFPGVPPYFATLSRMDRIAEHDLSSVRCVTNAAAALPLPLIREIRRIFPCASIVSMYGQTECVRATYLPPRDLERKPDSVGIPIPDSELWIEDERGQRVGPNEVGELIVRSPTLMIGYWDDPVGTRERLRPGPLPGEVVLHTGDFFRQDEEGYFYFVGRKDDLLNCGGEKVAPVEIEQVLLEMSGLQDVVVVGVPDPLLGEAVHALVVLEPGSNLTGAQIQRYCRSRLDPIKVPKIVQIVREVPRTSTGKIVRGELRTLANLPTEKGESRG